MKPKGDCTRCPTIGSEEGGTGKGEGVPNTVGLYPLFSGCERGNCKIQMKLEVEIQSRPPKHRSLSLSSLSPVRHIWKHNKPVVLGTFVHFRGGRTTSESQVPSAVSFLICEMLLEHTLCPLSPLPT